MISDLSPYGISVALTNSVTIVHRFAVTKAEGSFITSGYTISTLPTTHTLEVALTIGDNVIVARNTSSVKIETSVLGKVLAAELATTESTTSSPTTGDIEAGEWEYQIELARSGSEAQLNGWSDRSEVVTLALGTLLKGEQGDQGDTPTIGSNGNWWIGGVDTGLRAQGDQGYTPTIGDNGNWWIGGVDTGQRAQGDTGDVNLMSFEINDDGELIAVVPEGGNLVPSINDGGELIITIDNDE